MLIASPIAQGSDEKGVYWSVGSVGCGKYIEIKANVASKNLVNWYLAGWITAYNMVKPNTYNILGGKDLDGVNLWLENYCRANPLKNMLDGMEDLSTELYPKRHKTPKEAGH